MRDNPNAPANGIYYIAEDGLASFISHEERAEYAAMLPTLTKRQLRSHYIVHGAQCDLFIADAYKQLYAAWRNKLIIKSRREAELTAMAEDEVRRRKMKVSER